MHVLYLHQYFGTPDGTSGTRSYEMATALIRAGHRVTMVCGSADRSSSGLSAPFVKGRRTGTVDGIEIVEFELGYRNADGVAKRAWKFALFALRSIRTAIAMRYDVAVATTTPLTIVVPAVAARLFRGTPFVFEVRDSWPEIPRAMGMTNPVMLGTMSLLQALGCRLSRRQVALAPGIARGIAAAGASQDTIVSIPNGCDHALFDASATISPHDAFPESIAAADFVAIFAGAHGKANGLDAVVDAAAVLKRRGVDTVKILLIGDGSEKARLVERATAAGLANIVFSPPIPKRRLIGIIKGAGCGLQTLANLDAFYEGTSPNKFFDYLAAGLPVVINYPGWLGRLVEQTRSGIAVPPDDPEALADALIAMAASPVQRAEMAANATALGVDQFSRSAAQAAFVEVVEAAADPASSGTD